MARISDLPGTRKVLPTTRRRRNFGLAYRFIGNSSDKRLPTTLTSPDTYYLINMTPIELYEDHLKGIPLYTKMTAAIRQRTVVCFIKMYESEYKGEKNVKYPTLRMFMEENLAKGMSIVSVAGTTGSSASIEDMHGTATTTAITMDKFSQESQLFTPTLGKVLQETTRKTTDAGESGSTGKGVKRHIQFGSIENKDLDPQSPETETVQLVHDQEARATNKKSKEAEPKNAD